MARPVIPYDKDLPEIPGRMPHLRPAEYLRRKEGKGDEFEIVDERRPSKLLLVNKLRKAVQKWSEDDYPGASQVTLDLFRHWFEEDHTVGGRTFRFYFGQREAIETLVYLVEIEKNRDGKALAETFGEVFYPPGTQRQLAGTDIVHQTLTDGRRQIRRYIPELDGETIQDLPEKDIRRYAVKMATGSGKTVVIAMAAVWSYFHRRKVPDSDLATNFLILAPNVIVYQRLEKDFRDHSIFRDLPLIPREWKSEWEGVKVILRGEAADPDPSGNLFLVNIQQVYESRETEWTPANAVESLLGRKPVKDIASQGKSFLARIKTLPNLVVINDEAHHVHEADLEWHKSIMAIHEALPSGLGLWLDFSATPKDQNGTYFPWVVSDYPLAQAVEDRIIKAPLIVQRVKKDDPAHIISKGNVVKAYGEWILAALSRWREHYKIYKGLGPKPVLFIMCEKNVFADAIGEWLVKTEQAKLKKNEVLVIHTDKEGEITKKAVEEAREAARDIDLPTNKIKVIVSVLMLREGWDVRNVTVVLGLRPMNSDARILPEQAVGRGLRLMEGIGPDSTQTLEVLGTQEFEKFVRELEKEGVGIRTTATPPKPPVKVAPVQDRMKYDIKLPMTQPSYSRDYRRLKDINPMSLKPVHESKDLNEALKVQLRMEFGTLGVEVHKTDIGIKDIPESHVLIGQIAQNAMGMAGLTADFAELFPIVHDYVAKRCFGKVVDIDSEKVRSHLYSALTQEGIATYLASEIGRLTATRKPLELEKRWKKLSNTREFTWRRNLPLIECKKTVFNLVATFNNYEKAFGRFLDNAKDVARFASLGTTEQESGADFRVEYVKPASGAIGYYYPDWVVVQKSKKAEVSWIVETKGRVWEGTEAKDAAMSNWCSRVSTLTGTSWRFARVNQADFEARQPANFSECLEIAAVADDRRS